VRVRAARETEPDDEPLIGSAGVVVVGGGGIGTGVGMGGGFVVGVSHTATPPWWEHVPERVAEKL
jgi:hypothetical protein